MWEKEPLLGNLTTEGRNPASEGVDCLSALEIVRLMNSEDAQVAETVGRQSDSIARAIEVVAAQLRAGGRLIYLGAGTSGRLGVLDAAECPPTFQTHPDQVVGIIAGGPGAMFRSVEGAEDHPESAAADLQAIGACGKDAVVGIATSGRTPYVIGGLEYARSQGAYTIALACNREASLTDHAELAITPVVGPEVISGSTRLKAGTATKMVLNMISTGAMVLLGKTYGNLMVDLRATNSKLTDRAQRIVAAITGLSEAAAAEQLAQSQGEVKTAIVAHLCSVSAAEARQLLEQSQGQLRQTLAAHQRPAEVAGGPATSKRGTAGMDTRRLVLGIDGGATKTVAWLAPRAASTEQPLVGRGAAGSSNLQGVGRAQMLANLDRAIAAAFADAGVEPGPVAAAVLALAGSDREENRQVVQRWAQQRQLADRFVVIHDALPVLAAGTPAGWGVALIAGTGSLAFGRDRNERTARAGGWGFLFGDEGSGYALALAGLRAAAQAADGRGPSTQLLAGALHRLGLSDPKGLIPAIYPLAADRAAIASLAQLVTTAAGADDSVAQHILAEAANELAAMVAVTAGKLGFSSAPFPLALAGGLLLSDQRLQDQLIARLRSLGLCPDPIASVPDPVLGAVRLAQSAAAS